MAECSLRRASKVALLLSSSYPDNDTRRNVFQSEVIFSRGFGGTVALSVLGVFADFSRIGIIVNERATNDLLDLLESKANEGGHLPPLKLVACSIKCADWWKPFMVTASPTWISSLKTF